MTNSSWFDSPKVTIASYKDFTKILYARVSSLFGPLYLAVASDSIVSFSFKDESAYLKKTFPQASISCNEQEVQSYFDAITKPSAKINVIACGTNLQEAVWSALLDIPYGTLVNYSQVAQSIQKPKATRAVANAIGKNPIIYLIPCHRVIRKDGSLGGFSCGLDKKVAFLKLEGSLTLHK
jgi:O-6-methylguanine DNA methyltransferase